MVKRIFRTMVLIAVMAVILTAALTVPAMYNTYESWMYDLLGREAAHIIYGIGFSEDAVGYLSGMDSENRISLVAEDGTVLYDSDADIAGMENHAQRPEIAQAIVNGVGKSIRTSGTFSETTLYYAERMEDGNVLRISSTRSSVVGIFLNMMPLIIGMLLAVVAFSFIVARVTAGFIVAPINSLILDSPLDNDTYDELAPLLTRMDRQHSQIERQLKDLERAKTEMAAIMENMSEGMLLLDDKNTVLSMNGSAVAVFGVKTSSAVGANVMTVTDDEGLRELIKNAQNGTGGDMLLERDERTYRIFASPVFNESKLHGTVLLALDITEQFAAEKSRREFTANVSHELKTPLTSISGYAEIIRDGIAQPEDIQRFAGKICAEAGRLVTLVNDILELSKLDEGQTIGDMSTMRLDEIMKSIVDDFEHIAQKKSIHMELKCDDSAICGYPLLVRELFANLVDNAVRYTNDGGRIAVSVEGNADNVTCSVADNGIGIPEAHQAHIFERFYRVDKSHSRITGGTGLGMAIVKHVAGIHHAELKLDSAEGKGTKVTVVFPK